MEAGGLNQVLDLLPLLRDDDAVLIIDVGVPSARTSWPRPAGA